MIAKLVALVLPLGLDTFVVAASIGTLDASSVTRRRVSILFPAFEAVMPLVGLAVGIPLSHAIGSAADYIAIAVLLAVGLYALLGSDEHEEQTTARLVTATGPTILLIGLAISIDELAIGFTLGLLDLPVVLVIALIAAQAIVITQLGLRLGANLSKRFAESAEKLSGIALSILALVLLAEKLAG